MFAEAGVQKGNKSGRGMIMDEEAMTPLHVCPEPKQCGGSESSTVAADAAADDDPALAYALAR